MIEATNDNAQIENNSYASFLRVSVKFVFGFWTLTKNAK